MRRTRSRLAAACLGVALAAAGLGGCATPVRYQSTLISHNAAATNGGNGPSTAPSISSDGTKIAFVSEARNFGLPDTNGVSDVFVRDTTTGTISLVSINRQGTNSGNGMSSDPIISADGTKVAFLSFASNLVPLPVSGPGNGAVYVHDLATGTTTAAMVNVAETEVRRLSSFFNAADMFDFSTDGSKVAFVSDGPDLAAGFGSSIFQVYVRDLSTGATSVASVDATGTNFGNNASLFPRLSAGGDSISFSSFATDLVPGGTPGSSLSLFARDLEAGTTLRLAEGFGSGLGSTPSNTAFNTDGTSVAYETADDDLGHTDTNGDRDVYVTDLVAGTTALVSVRSDGADSGNGASSEASFSLDGTKVVFTSSASDLVAGDTNEESDVFVRDLAAGTTSLVSVDEGGGSAVAGSRRGVFAGDGQVLFESLAWDFGPTDGNNDWDLYIRNLNAGVTSLVSAREDGTDSGDEASTTGAFGGGRVAYQSRATDLDGTDTNATWDIYLAGLYTPPPPPSTTTTAVPTTLPPTSTTTTTTTEPPPGD